MIGILLNENNDLSVKNGTIEVGDIKAQVVELVISANKGEFKEVPLIGGEINKKIGENTDLFWRDRVKKDCKAMGVELKNVTITGSEIEIEIQYDK